MNPTSFYSNKKNCDLARPHLNTELSEGTDLSSESDETICKVIMRIVMNLWARNCSIAICIVVATTILVTQRNIYNHAGYLWWNLFVEILKVRKPLTVSARNFITYVWEGNNYASVAVSFSCIVNKATRR